MNTPWTQRYRRKLRLLLPKKPKLEFQESYLGIEERWSIVSRHLPERRSWILDVGSNLGDTARRAAKLGHVVVGVEAERQLVERAIKLVPPNVALMTGRVDPEFFRSMPRFDVVLLLSVLHRIWAVHGRRFAEECVTACAGRTDRILVEGAVRHQRYTQYGSEAPDFPCNDLAAGIAWHLRWLGGLAPEGWTIRAIGHVAASEREPHRPLFVMTAKAE